MARPNKTIKICTLLLLCFQQVYSAKGEENGSTSSLTAFFDENKESPQDKKKRDAQEDLPTFFPVEGDLLEDPSKILRMQEIVSPSRDEKSFLLEDSESKIFDREAQKESELDRELAADISTAQNEPPSIIREKKEGLVAQTENEVAQTENEEEEFAIKNSGEKTPPKTILINFNNVGIIEYIRFISRITNRNFVFDERDLQFNVTVISEEPTTIDNVMTALIQELRVHGLSLIEQGNSFIIHRNQDVHSISRVNADAVVREHPKETEIVTQVFKFNTLDPAKARDIIRPLLSKEAQIEISEETQHIVVTDLVSNIQQIAILFKSLDAPNSGLVIGQYVVKNSLVDNLVDLVEKIMQPIAQGQQLTFVPHHEAKSIFVISSPFLVDRTISVLQHLDSLEGTTNIYDLNDLQYKKAATEEEKPLPTLKLPEEAEEAEEAAPPTEAQGKWELNPQGNFVFRPGYPTGSQSPNELPQGEWALDPQNNWFFIPKGGKAPFLKRESTSPLPGESPKGRWVFNPQGTWVFQLSPGEPLKPQRLTRKAKIEEELPVGHIERTQFYIYKLQFRRGQDLVDALQQIGGSLRSANADLIAAIDSVQWLESSNYLVVAGTNSAIEKIKKLIEQIDTPLRQVLIEMLILETTIDDSLDYGVSWGTRSGGGNTSTSQAFIGGASPLVGALSTAGISDGSVKTPSAATLATTLGYNLGVIGQRITHNGTQFASIGALVTALHEKAESNIVLNPKIITEDNQEAEIFVGINTRFQTQAVSNDQGSIITTNFEFRDVGTTLRVTPLIGNNNIITLEIEQEVSRVISDGGATSGDNITDISPGPTTSINRTKTTIHIPDDHFVVLSGMLQEEEIRDRNQFPCLGGIPIIGAAFSQKSQSDAKRNLMIFIKPKIVDTDQEAREITERQQDIFKRKNKTKNMWKYEVDEALDFLNVKPTSCNECYP